MKLTVERDALAAIVGVPDDIVPSRNTMAIVGNLLLRAEAGEISVTGTNLDQLGTGRCPARVAEDGAITVPSKDFAKLVGRVAAGANIDIALNLQTFQLVVKAGRSHYQLPTLPPDTFPSLEGADFMSCGDVGEAFFDALKAVVPACSTDPSRFTMQCVYIHAVPDGDALSWRVAALNGRIFFMREIGRFELGRDVPPVLIHRATAAAVAKLGNKVEMLVSKNLVHFHGTPHSLKSKMVDAAFIDYACMLPKRGAFPAALVDGAALLAALNRLDAVADADSGVFLRREPQGLLLIRRRPSGDGEELVEGEVDEAFPDCEMSRTCLADAARMLGGDTLRLQIEGPKKNMLIMAEGRDDRLALTSPMNREAGQS